MADTDMAARAACLRGAAIRLESLAINLTAEVADLRSTADAICAAPALLANLKNIATQKTTEELKAEGEQNYDDADFEGAYDALIHIARRAIQTTT